MKLETKALIDTQSPYQERDKDGMGLILCLLIESSDAQVLSTYWEEDCAEGPEGKLIFKDKNGLGLLY